MSDERHVPGDGSHTRVGSLHDPIVPRRSARPGINLSTLGRIAGCPWSFRQRDVLLDVAPLQWTTRRPDGWVKCEKEEGASHTAGQEGDEVDTDALKGEI